MLDKLPPWEALQKKMVFAQLGNIQNLKILDFGSGMGITASYYARNNRVIAIEPSQEILQNRFTENEYRQIQGDIDAVGEFEDSSFDMILCHNVLEYVTDRLEILREFYRVLKPGGILSVVKHNRPGRVMQMTVLLNEFEKAKALLDGSDGHAEQYGTIRYYEDAELTEWCKDLKVVKVFGIRAFWDLQQNQDCHKDPAWQEAMLEMEKRVSEIDVYRSIAFFHHLIIRKER